MQIGRTFGENPRLYTHRREEEIRLFCSDQTAGQRDWLDGSGCDTIMRASPIGVFHVTCCSESSSKPSMKLKRPTTKRQWIAWAIGVRVIKYSVIGLVWLYNSNAEAQTHTTAATDTSAPTQAAPQENTTTTAAAATATTAAAKTDMTLLAAKLLAQAALANTAVTQHGADTIGQAVAASELPGLVLTVTAARKRAPQVDSIPMLSVVDRRRIDETLADQTPDLLSATGGVHIQKTNYGGGSPFLHGVTGKQVLLLMDGVRLNNALYRFGPHQYLNTVSPHLLEQIEVVHGPTSVQYGTDALGGAINLLTRRGERYSDRNTHGFGVGVAFGSADRSISSTLAYYGATATSGVRMSISAQAFDDVMGGGDIGRQHPTGYQQASGNARYDRYFEDNWRLTLATHNLRQWDVPKTSEVTLDGKLRYNYAPQVQSLSYLQLHGTDLGWAVADTFSASASIQYHGEGEDVHKAADQLPTYERNDATSPGGYVQIGKQIIDQLHLLVGAEGYLDIIDSSKYTVASNGDRTAIRPAFPDDARYLTAGAFAQLDIEPHERLAIQLSGRGTLVDASGTLVDPDGKDMPLSLRATNISGNAGLHVRLVNQLYATAQVAQGFRAPNMEDFFGKVDFAEEIPNTELSSEKLLDLQAGLKYADRSLFAQAYIYRDLYTDLIDRADVTLDYDGDGTAETLAQRQNIARAQIDGVAAEMQLTVSTLATLEASYSYTRGRELEQVDGSWQEAGYMRRIPPHQGTFASRINFPGGVFVLPQVQWAAKQDQLSGGDIKDKRIPDGGTPGYAVLHLRAGVVMPDSSLRLGVENVLDKAYKTHGSGVYMPGRNLYVAYSHKL